MLDKEMEELNAVIRELQEEAESFVNFCTLIAEDNKRLREENNILFKEKIEAYERGWNDRERRGKE